MSMPTCPSCIYAQGICEKTGVKIRYSTGCTYHKQKPMTNYERIISKTPEKMAMWMWLRGCPTEEINESCMNNKTKEKSCTRCWLDWLKAPADKEGEG